MPPMAQRFIMRIELTGPAMKSVQDLSDRHGMTQLAMMSRLVEFFATRDELLQSSMMARLPQEMDAEIQKRLLRSLG